MAVDDEIFQFTHFSVPQLSIQFPCLFVERRDADENVRSLLEYSFFGKSHHDRANSGAPMPWLNVDGLDIAFECSDHLQDHEGNDLLIFNSDVYLFQGILQGLQGIRECPSQRDPRFRFGHHEGALLEISRRSRSFDLQTELLTNLFPYVSSHISLERRARQRARTLAYSPERFQSSRVVRIPCDLVEMSYVVGVDVGGTKTRVGLGNSRGRMVSRLSERTDKSSGPTGISRQTIRMIRSLVSPDRIRCIGVGSAGPLDLKDGSIVHSANLGFDRVPLIRPLEKEFKTPVYLANDCVAAVIAEKEFGQGKRCSNLVYVTLSSGIGAGVIVDNHLLVGKDGNAHEVGHITIDHSGKLECGCGKRGHWEAYCGGANIQNLIRLQMKSRTRKEVEPSLLHQASESGPRGLSSEYLFESARKGDHLALEIVEEIGRLNAIGFANIINVYDPELITVGGSITLSNINLILKPIRRLIGRYSVNRIPQIKPTKLGEDIVLYGALVLCKRLRQACQEQTHTPNVALE